MCKVTIGVYEFMKEFPDKDTVRGYLEGRRWKGDITCPYRAVEKVTRQRDLQYLRYRSCRKVFTVRTGTVVERSHIPLDKWLYAMYLFSTARKGVSSMQLSKEIGITQKSAWFMLQRLREACKVLAYQRAGPTKPMPSMLPAQLLLIEHKVDDDVIHQRPRNEYVNATQMYKKAGKLFGNYYRNQSTKEFLNTLESDM